MVSIQTLFKPLQPTISPRHSKVIRYTEWPPVASLKEYVYCYWQLRSLEPLPEKYMYRVVSDGCIDILIDVPGNYPFITGFSKKYVRFDLGHSFHYLGIRFYPFMFPLLFNISAKKVVDQFLPLEDLLPELHTKLAALAIAGDEPEEVCATFNLSLTPYAQNIPEHDPRFSKTIDQILLSGGNIQINELDMDISERQLRRMFQFYLGESPKVFAKVFRFQNLLNAYLSTQSQLTEKIFYDLGYYDQAHFIKDFKRFYGVTPLEAFPRE